MKIIRLLGLSPYDLVHPLQERLIELRAEGRVGDTILMLEHPATITLGRRRNAIDSVLEAGDVPVVRIERGGDATYHAPGQLVAYPLIALEGADRDLLLFLRRIEEAVMDLIGPLGLSPTRDDRNTGVWLASPLGVNQKVCSIGVACRKWVTWHGLALNVDVDLAGFARIRPCGFSSGVMTRLADHLSPCPSIDQLAKPLGEALVKKLGDGHMEWEEYRVETAEDVERIIAAQLKG